MQQRGVPPDFLTYTSMIKAFYMTNKPSRAKKIEEMRGMWQCGSLWT